MISFSQLLILLFLGILLLGDTRQLFNKMMLFFFNIKTIFTKKLPREKTTKKNEK